MYWSYHYVHHPQRRLRWLSHVLSMSDERIPKALLYNELVVGKRNVSRPRLTYKDVCIRDLKSLKNVDIDEWERPQQKAFSYHGESERLRKRENQFLRDQRRRRRNQNKFIYFLRPYNLNLTLKLKM